MGRVWVVPCSGALVYILHCSVVKTCAARRVLFIGRRALKGWHRRRRLDLEAITVFTSPTLRLFLRLYHMLQQSPALRWCFLIVAFLSITVNALIRVTHFPGSPLYVRAALNTSSGRRCPKPKCAHESRYQCSRRL